MNTNTVMTIEESRRTQRPYRYGMILLCFGALANWLGLAENYAEPVRYLGVACIIAGALLICTAMCCWLHTPQRTGSGSEEGNNSLNVMTVSSEIRCEKPPEYDTVAVLSPPSYDDAIKLNPSVFLAASNAAAPSSSATTTTTVYLPEAVDSSKEESSSSTMVYPVSVNKSANSSSLRPPSPPVYTISTAMPNEVVTYDNERFTNDHRRSSTASRGGMEVMAASRR